MAIVVPQTALQKEAGLWQPHIDAERDIPYWYNSSTHVSQWEMPDVVRRYRELHAPRPPPKPPTPPPTVRDSPQKASLIRSPSNASGTSKATREYEEEKQRRVQAAEKKKKQAQDREDRLIRRNQDKQRVDAELDALQDSDDPIAVDLSSYTGLPAAPLQMHRRLYFRYFSMLLQAVEPPRVLSTFQLIRTYGTSEQTLLEGYRQMITSYNALPRMQAHISDAREIHRLHPELKTLPEMMRDLYMQQTHHVLRRVENYDPTRIDGEIRRLRREFGNLNIDLQRRLCSILRARTGNSLMPNVIFQQAWYTKSQAKQLREISTAQRYGGAVLVFGDNDVDARRQNGSRKYAQGQAKPIAGFDRCGITASIITCYYAKGSSIDRQFLSDLRSGSHSARAVMEKCQAMGKDLIFPVNPAAVDNSDPSQPKWISAAVGANQCVPQTSIGSGSARLSHPRKMAIQKEVNRRALRAHRVTLLGKTQRAEFDSRYLRSQSEKLLLKLKELIRILNLFRYDNRLTDPAKPLGAGRQCHFCGSFDKDHWHCALKSTMLGLTNNKPGVYESAAQQRLEQALYDDLHAMAERSNVHYIAKNSSMCLRLRRVLYYKHCDVRCLKESWSLNKQRVYDRRQCNVWKGERAQDEFREAPAELMWARFPSLRGDAYYDGESSSSHFGTRDDEDDDDAAEDDADDSDADGDQHMDDDAAAADDADNANAAAADGAGTAVLNADAAADVSTVVVAADAADAESEADADGDQGMDDVATAAKTDNVKAAAAAVADADAAAAVVDADGSKARAVVAVIDAGTVDEADADGDQGMDDAAAVADADADAVADADADAEAEQLRRLLVKLNYPRPVDQMRICRGVTNELLPLLHFGLLSHSKVLAAFLIDAGYDLYSQNDLRFTQGVFKLMRDEFEYQPEVQCAQFLTDTGFARRKIHFVVKCLKFGIAKHNELIKSARVPSIIYRVTHGQSDHADATLQHQHISKDSRAPPKTVTNTLIEYDLAPTILPASPKLNNVQMTQQEETPEVQLDIGALLEVENAHCPTQTQNLDTALSQPAPNGGAHQIQQDTRTITVLPLMEYTHHRVVKAVADGIAKLAFISRLNRQWTHRPFVDLLPGAVDGDLRDWRVNGRAMTDAEICRFGQLWICAKCRLANDTRRQQCSHCDHRRFSDALTASLCFECGSVRGNSNLIVCACHPRYDDSAYWICLRCESVGTWMHGDRMWRIPRDRPCLHCGTTCELYISGHITARSLTARSWRPWTDLPVPQCLRVVLPDEDLQLVCELLDIERIYRKQRIYEFRSQISFGCTWNDTCTSPCAKPGELCDQHARLFQDSGRPPMCTGAYLSELTPNDPWQWQSSPPPTQQLAQTDISPQTEQSLSSACDTTQLLTEEALIAQISTDPLSPDEPLLDQPSPLSQAMKSPTTPPTIVPPRIDQGLDEVVEAAQKEIDRLNDYLAEQRNVQNSRLAIADEGDTRLRLSDEAHTEMKLREQHRDSTTAERALYIEQQDRIPFESPSTSPPPPPQLMHLDWISTRLQRILEQIPEVHAFEHPYINDYQRSRIPDDNYLIRRVYDFVDESWLDHMGLPSDTNLTEYVLRLRSLQFRRISGYVAAHYTIGNCHCRFIEPGTSRTKCITCCQTRYLQFCIAQLLEYPHLNPEDNLSFDLTDAREIRYTDADDFYTEEQLRCPARQLYEREANAERHQLHRNDDQLSAHSAKAPSDSLTPEGIAHSMPNPHSGTIEPNVIGTKPIKTEPSLHDSRPRRPSLVTSETAHSEPDECKLNDVVEDSGAASVPTTPRPSPIKRKASELDEGLTPEKNRNRAGTVVKRRGTSELTEQCDLVSRPGGLIELVCNRNEQPSEPDVDMDAAAEVTQEDEDID
jgi:hypothetical protein